MASMILSGDTSGTVTLSAPLVAGSNTATLPAATGELSMLGGAGQTWQTLALVSGTTYYNTSNGKPIVIKVTVGGTTTVQIQSTVNGYVLPFQSYSVSGSTFFIQDTYIVPPGQSYSTTALSGSINSAAVLR